MTQILQNNIDVSFVQEPYTVLNSVAGFPKTFKNLPTVMAGKEKS
jgi:hypothetical protein